MPVLWSTFHNELFCPRVFITVFNVVFFVNNLIINTVSPRDSGFIVAKKQTKSAF